MRGYRFRIALLGLGVLLGYGHAFSHAKHWRAYTHHGHDCYDHHDYLHGDDYESPARPERRSAPSDKSGT